MKANTHHPHCYSIKLYPTQSQDSDSDPEECELSDFPPIREQKSTPPALGPFTPSSCPHPQPPQKNSVPSSSEELQSLPQVQHHQQQNTGLG